MTTTHLKIKRVIDRVWMQPAKIQLDVKTVKRLRQLALRIHRQLEIQCNGYVYEYRPVFGSKENQDYFYNIWKNKAQKDVIKSIKVDEKCRNELVEILAPLDLHFYIQEDPRGATLYISETPLTDQNYYRGVCVA